MSKDQFGRLVNQLSEQAVGERAAEARQLEREKMRRKIRQALLVVLVLCIGAYVGVNHAELQAQITKLLPAQESEYQKLMAVGNEVAAGQTTDGSTPAANPNSRPARIKNALVNANQRTAIADSIIDNTAPPKTYVEQPPKP